MAVHVRYFTDPACVASWGAEPAVRKLMVEFGEDVRFTYVMGGLAREYDAARIASQTWAWLAAAERTRMPVDPRLWKEGPLRSSYPACMAVRAAAQQASDGGYVYLRALREGIIAFRRKLDTTEALVEEARRAGLDAERFRVDLGSHATVEAFGADLDAARDVPEEARAAGEVVERDGHERVSFPGFLFEGEDGRRRWVLGEVAYEAYREATLACGGRATGEAPPDAAAALRRFGRMAPVEVEAVCELPGPRASAELWRLASEWKARPEAALTGTFFEPA